MSAPRPQIQRSESNNSSFTSIARPEEENGEYEEYVGIEKSIFSSINEGNREKLQDIFKNYPNTTAILQLLLTTAYPNTDGFYKHDADVQLDVDHLLGSRCTGLNALHIACILGDEEIASDILEFVVNVTEEIEAKKILYEFMGRVWGEGNTVLHLASFMGMSGLVKRLLELGAAPNKVNDKKYKPVDCADCDETRAMFSHYAEVIPIERGPLMKSSDNLSSSPADSPSGSPLPSEINRAKESELEKSADELGPKKDKSNGPKIKRSNSTRVKAAHLHQPNIKAIARRSSLAAIDSSIITSTPKPKLRKIVSFDVTTLILDICHFGDPKDNTTLPTLRKYLNLPSYENRQCQIKTANSDVSINLNRLQTGHQSLTPIHLASSHGQIAIVELLISEIGININVRDKEGWTPLHCACAEGHLEVIKLLGQCQGTQLKGGQQVQATKESGNWFYPADGPINLKALNNDGETPAEVALESKINAIETLISELLVKYPHNEEDYAQETCSLSAKDEEGSGSGDEDYSSGNEDNMQCEEEVSEMVEAAVPGFEAPHYPLNNIVEEYKVEKPKIDTPEGKSTEAVAEIPEEISKKDNPEDIIKEKPKNTPADILKSTEISDVNSVKITFDNVNTPSKNVEVTLDTRFIETLRDKSEGNHLNKEISPTTVKVAENYPDEQCNLSFTEKKGKFASNTPIIRQLYPVSNKPNMHKSVSASRLPEPAPVNNLAENMVISDSLPFSEMIRRFTVSNVPAQPMTIKSPIPIQKKFDSASSSKVSDQPLMINKKQDSPSLQAKQSSSQKLEPKTNTTKYSQDTPHIVQLGGTAENINEPKILSVKERMGLFTGRRVPVDKPITGSKEDISKSFGSLEQLTKKFESNESLNTSRSARYQVRGQATEIMPPEITKISDTLKANADKKLLSANGEPYKPPADILGRRNSFKNKMNSKNEVVGGDFSWMVVPNERERQQRRSTAKSEIRQSTEKVLKDSEA